MNPIVDTAQALYAKPGSPLSPAERIMAHRRLEEDYGQAFIVDHKGKDLQAEMAGSPRSGARDRSPMIEDIDRMASASDTYSDMIAEAARGRLWGLLDQDGNMFAYCTTL